MGLFSWLFGKSEKSTVADPSDQYSGSIIDLAPYGDFIVHVVGESHYQDALEAIAGPKNEDGYDLTCVAELWPERGNPHDDQAVAVLIRRKVVGYLKRADARSYRKHMGVVIGRCRARIRGGWLREDDGDEGDFGVTLDADWPPRPAR